MRAGERVDTVLMESGERETIAALVRGNKQVEHSDRCGARVDCVGSCFVNAGYLKSLQ